MSVDAEDFLVFGIYRDAGEHAFSNDIVTQADKDSYNAIFSHLRDAVAGAIDSAPASDELDDWTVKFGRKGGVQGHRPKDLWASIINRGSEAFSKFPQVYVIASETGVEVGFSVTIHEDDYYNAEVKRKNRSIVPIINAKLPDPDSDIVSAIDAVLSSETGWIYAAKTRQGSQSSFAGLPELVAHLRSGASTTKGGGAIYRILDFEEVADSDVRLEQELSHVLTLFRPIMQLLQPTSEEAQLARNMQQLADYSEQLPPFEPDSEEDGRRKVLRQIAIRQGQAKFRDDLLEAYDGRCAISGCPYSPVLQAAHISPYNGTKSNHISNGLPLRADIHTLFDLGLIRIDPDTRTVSVASSLAGSDYEQYSGRPLADPAKPAHRPSRAALAKKLERFPAGD